MPLLFNIGGTGFRRRSKRNRCEPEPVTSSGEDVSPLLGSLIDGIGDLIDGIGDLSDGIGDLSDEFDDSLGKEWGGIRICDLD